VAAAIGQAHGDRARCSATALSATSRASVAKTPRRATKIPLTIAILEQKFVCCTAAAYNLAHKTQGSVLIFGDNEYRAYRRQ
jgi:hypothetical protein